MSKIPEAIRAAIEEAIDRFLSDPAKSREHHEDNLIKLGIEPTVDSILAMFCGVLIGSMGMIELKGRGQTEAKEIIDRYFPLLERRAWEMRQAMLNERMK